MWFSFLFLTLVTVVSLAGGGVVAVVYLLFAPARKRMDRWMNRQDEQIWADTLAFVDAEKEKYQRTKRMRDRGRLRAGGPVFRPRVQHSQAVEEEYDQDALPF